jgi:hypothetical protein
MLGNALWLVDICVGGQILPSNNSFSCCINNLSSILKSTVIKLGLVALVCTLSSQEVKAGG